MRSATLLYTTTVAAFVLIFVGTTALGETPGPSASGQEVADWFAAQGGQARMYAWLVVLFVPFFATFTALVRARLPRPHRDVFLIGAIALIAETSVSTWIWAGLSWHAEQLEPATARTLLDVASFWGPVLNGATISMLAPVVVLSWGARAVLPRWLGIVGGVALAEQTIETITIFGHTGFIAPGGPMNLMLGAALVSIWLLCLGIRLARNADTGRPGTVEVSVEAQPAAS